MKRFALLWLVGTAMLVGCSLKMGPRTEPSRIQMDGLGTAYAAVCGIRPYDGTILEANILEGKRDGEILSLDIWPLGGVGIGLIGARAQVLPLEAAAGLLFYQPQPVQYESKKTEGPYNEKDTDSTPES